MSGRKSNLPKFQILTAGDMSSSTPLVSAVTNIEHLDNIALQFNFSGTPTGAFAVEVSVDYAQDANGNVTNPGTWVPMALSPAPAAAGAAGSIFIDIQMTSAPWIRSKYTKASGSGLLDMWISAKMV
jgi:hypothetical protein